MIWLVGRDEMETDISPHFQPLELVISTILNIYKNYINIIHSFIKFEKSVLY